uniref:Uncharacterized protein n=1 Tax=Ananas comosus var. bracteatus TaxID=296719 RepID=A0A6V7QRM9_ANACO
MRSVAISDALPPPPLSVPQSVWHSPVSFLFGGLAAMLGLIAFALLILACSYWKLYAHIYAAVAAVPQPPPLNWRRRRRQQRHLRRHRASWSSWRETTSPRSSPCRCVAAPWTCPCRVAAAAATRVR